MHSKIILVLIKASLKKAIRKKICQYVMFLYHALHPLGLLCDLS